MHVPPPRSSENPPDRLVMVTRLPWYALLRWTGLDGSASDPALA
jgi:hypothetical protein